MIMTLKCSSCSGPLQFEGGTSQICGFCGSTILVSANLLSTDASDNNSEHSAVFAEINKLIAEGKKIYAIKLYHETFRTGLGEAKDAVDKLERGEK